MSLNIVNKTTGALSQVAGNADDSGIGNLNSLTTTDKSSLVNAVNELKSGSINDHNKIVLNEWDSAYSENKNDANKANALFLAFNGWDSNITNFPTEATNQLGTLSTVWESYNSIGDLTANRSQTLTLQNGNVFMRSYNASLSTPWSNWQSGLMSAAKAVYKDYHQIAASGNYTFTPTLEVNHAYLVTICAGNNIEWGYCGIMLKGWTTYAPVLSDIYKGISITVTMVDIDSIQVSNTNSQYDSSFEIIVIDFGRGYQGS